ncbi:hypothetical protein KKC31_03515, partial [Patescibacteria group bacterium]|nr:hypothetical protein [Patescibacteria group bacterium]
TSCVVLAVIVLRVSRSRDAIRAINGKLAKNTSKSKRARKFTGKKNFIVVVLVRLSADTE